MSNEITICTGAGATVTKDAGNGWRIGSFFTPEVSAWFNERNAQIIAGWERKRAIAEAKRGRLSATQLTLLRCNLNARIRYGRHFLRVEIWRKTASPRLVEIVDTAASREVES